jgi:AraC-like DNA-binding protein
MFAAEMRMRDGQTCFMHTHACAEIVWYCGCAGWLPQGGERYRYGDGDVAIYQPWLVHGDECEKGGVQLCVGISGAQAEKLPPGLWRADESTRRVLRQIQAVLGAHDDWRAQRLNLLAGWLVVELARQLTGAPTGGQRDPYHVAQARRIMDSRFAEPLSVSGIADELSITSDYLRQLFVKWAGEPPMRYLIRKRLAAACDLLRLNQEKTADIAAKVGIPNAFYFSRLFRQRMGETPTQYRARYAARG